MAAALIPNIVHHPTGGSRIGLKRTVGQAGVTVAAYTTIVVDGPTLTTGTVALKGAVNQAGVTVAVRITRVVDGPAPAGGRIVLKQTIANQRTTVIAGSIAVVKHPPAPIVGQSAAIGITARNEEAIQHRRVG